ncbi:MAG: SpoIIE family protein phosphatase [Candidatus Marinimicrobia bacterium]|nr:SpoIIE family protein phosphatase [Candidatus Neomarinimicrobiota bacterium]
MTFIEGEEPLKAVLNSLTDGVIVADMNGEFLFFNPAAEEILGIGSREVAQANWTSVYGCYQTDRVTPYPSEQLPLARAIRGEEIIDEHIFIRNLERTEGVWISISASPLKDEKGSVWCGIMIFRNITKLRRQRDRLERFASGVEQTADSVVITNLQGVIEYVNPAFEVTSGYKRDEVLGQTPQILNSGKHDKEFYKNLWETILSGMSYRGTIINKKKNGELYWSDQSITPLNDQSGNMVSFVSVLKDITELRNLQYQEFQLNIARQVQQMYYNTEITVPGFDIAGAAYPADKIGGDYFDFIPMPDGCIAIAVGDVIGHGIGAALIMAEMRAFLRVFTKMDNDPATILSKVNTELFADLQSEQFVTLILARLDPNESSLVYASAGHVPAYLLNRSGKVDYVMESTGLPLGFQKDYEIKNSEPIKLTPNDIAVFFTDGIMEAQSPDGEEFGFDRALDLIKCKQQTSAHQIIETLYRGIGSFTTNNSQEDDITSVILKVNPNS